MAKGTLNKVILIGNVGADVKYSDKGTPVAKISMATTEVTKDKEEKTEWHNVTMFGKIAELANNYVIKGSKILVEGRLQLNKWTDKDGILRYSTDVIAHSIQLLGGKKREANAAPASGGYGDLDTADIPF